MPQSLAKLTVHLIFSTKNRVRFLAPELQPELDAYLVGILRNQDSPSIVTRATDDHVHILFALSRTAALSKVVAEVKSASSKWLKTQSPELADFAWQNGYGAFSVSESSVGQVRDYIRNQDEHHRRMTFQDEFRAFLRKHKIEFDERYVWD